jgi:Trypsin-like peptidase domain
MLQIFSLVAMLCLMISSKDAHAGRSIPDDNLAYPVHIVLKDGKPGQGSGFYLDTGEKVYLVTARHVLLDPLTKKLHAPTAEVVSYSKIPTEAQRNVTSIDLAGLEKAGKVIVHSIEDVALVEIGDIAEVGKDRIVKPDSNVKFLEKAPSGMLFASLKSLKTFESVLVGNDVIVFGYPSSIGIKDLPQIDYNRPLLRKGLVAGQNMSRKLLVLDAPVYPGNSGGPVLEIDNEGFQRRYRVIGIVSQFVPFAEVWKNSPHGYENLTISNSGYSIATPMDFVLELLRLESSTKQ